MRRNGIMLLYNLDTIYNGDPRYPQKPTDHTYAYDTHSPVVVGICGYGYGSPLWDPFTNLERG